MLQFIAQQTLLRETGMIDMLLQILKVPFDLEQRFLIRKVLLDIQVLDASNSSAEFSRTGEQRISFDDIKCNREPVLSEIFSFVYKMLSVFMLGSDHENQLLVAKEFDILSRHFSLDIGAADAIMQLISGNILIAQSVSEDQILHFMGSLEHDKNPHVVEFLNALCYLDGKPIPKHQTFISRHLVEITGSKIRRTFMNETRVRKSVIEILENPILDSWTPLHEIFDKEEDGLSPQKLKTGISKHKNQQKMFFISTLRLYEALCKGHNRFSINKIVYEWKLITLDECIVGLFDNRLPNSVRALYCDLIRGEILQKGWISCSLFLTSFASVIFVDYYPISNARNEFILTFEGLEQPPTLNMVLSDANLRGPFQTLPEGPDSDNTSDQSSIFGLHREGFFKIDEWLLKFFEEHRAQYMDHVKENQLVLSTLQLARLLIRYGFYRNMEQFERIIFSMLEILDGRNDAR